MNRETCKGCIHHKLLLMDGFNPLRCCFYLLDTGNRRECPPESCDKKKLPQDGK